MATNGQAGLRVLDALIERLYAALARGPAINCYPGNSRQRVDLDALSRLDASFDGSAILQALLGSEAKFQGRLTIPALPPKPPAGIEEDPATTQLRRTTEERTRLLRKLAALASDADTYFKDTGSYILYIGYPLLSIPSSGGRHGRGPSRILAPLTFIPVGLKVTTGARSSVLLECAEEGADRVIANSALKTWVERSLELPFPDLFEDEEGEDPAREIRELSAHVTQALGLTGAKGLEGWPTERVPELKQLPDSPTLLHSAVLGLYHLRNQSTIRDMEALREGTATSAIVGPFLTLDAALVASEATAGDSAAPQDTTAPSAAAADEHLVDRADPCQRRAVVKARGTKGLVVHGPPGTGKSQTITNMIGDHLARGKRVLLVCEKMTALDVVKHRLDARGLGHLCAVVHDAQRDRAALFKSVREELEALADRPVLLDPSRELERINAEIDRLHAQLRAFFGELDAKEPRTGKTLHQLVGHWLAHGGTRPQIEGLDQANPGTLIERENDVRALYARLAAARHGHNAFEGRHALTLADYLSRDMEAMRGALDTAVTKARAAVDVTLDGLPAWESSRPLASQAAAFRTAGEALRQLERDLPAELLRRAGAMSSQMLDTLHAALSTLEPLRQLAEAAPLDPTLNARVLLAPLSAAQAGEGVAALTDYQVKCRGILGFFQFGAKNRAAAALAPLGLPLSQEGAAQARAFLEGVQARLLLRGMVEQTIPGYLPATAADADLFSTWRHLGRVAAAHMAVASASRTLLPLEAEALKHAGGLDALGGRMERAAAGALKLEDCIDALVATKMLKPEALDAWRQRVLRAEPIAEDVEALRASLDALELLLRFESEAAGFPPAVGDSLRAAFKANQTVAEAWDGLMAGAYFGAARAHLRSQPLLQQQDTARLDGDTARLRELKAQKMALEVQAIQRQWHERQRARLLASTGSRLNAAGSDLRRRLGIRGRNASRLRETIASGHGAEGGDPLFELRPVWMTSPQTACQIFPLEPFFDVVIFDEASQCRLEEGLPVLMRGASVVIAGDTKQLPPTAFFQVAAASSTETMEADDTEQGLFETRQAEIEDLLSAALNIEIEQSYLDVHYRSTSSDLIAFSNEAFYNSRLQPLPGHPNNRARHPGVRMHRIAGTLEDRQNEGEAAHVVKLVKDLLAQPKPPSIGIATFNLPQKDLIEERLAEAAEQDESFRTALTTARERRRDGAYEGLFVKNLENVQGDERDVIIISTTFAPGKDGKFRRRFGPLATQGGERRLNVIVTRARRQVELVTSIPPAIYRADSGQAIPAGQRPNGAWYLMRYLAAAEAMEEAHARRLAEEATALDASDADGTPDPAVEIWPCDAPSLLVDTLAERLKENHALGSLLYYANDGFAVDIALRHPADPDRITLGVLTDVTRYPRALDRVEWDLFRGEILEGLGWKLHRLWTPAFMRDPEGALARLLEHQKREAADTPKKG